MAKKGAEINTQSWSEKYHVCLDYAINLRANAGLNYDTQRTYTVTVQCTDTKDTTSGTFTVYVLRNQPTTITNLQASKGWQLLRTKKKEKEAFNQNNRTQIHVYTWLCSIIWHRNHFSYLFLFKLSNLAQNVRNVWSKYNFILV